MVGSARIEIVGDLAAFSRDAESKVHDLMSNISGTIDTSMKNVDEAMGRSGAKSGDSFTSHARTAIESGANDYNKLADGIGQRFAENIAGGVRSGGGNIKAAVQHEGTQARETASRSFGEAGRAAGEKFGESAKESMKGIGGTIFAGVGLVGIGAVGEKSLEAADQVEAANIKIEGSFGESSKQVNTWAQSMAHNLGLSVADAENVAGTFGQMFHGMGLGQEQAAGMSEHLAELTENVAKFNNADPASVQAAFTAAMRGRGKALLALGINLDSTTIAGEALRHHLVSMNVDQAKVTAAQDALNKATAASAKINKDANATAAERKAATDKVAIAETALKDAMGGKLPVLTQSQKGLASYYAILDGTKNQEHAVADSSHTLAQQKKILGAEVTNLEAKMGAGLLPILTRLAEFVAGDVVPAFAEAGHWIKQNSDWLLPLALALGAALIAYKATSIAMGIGKTVMAGAAAVTALFTTSTEEATVAQEGLNTAEEANPIGIIIALLAALVVGIIYAWNHFKIFRTIIEDTWDGIKTAFTVAWDFIKTVFEVAWAGVRDIIVHPVEAAIGAVETAWTSVHDAFTAAWDWVEKVFGKVWGGIEAIIVHPISSAIGTVKQLWQDVEDFLSGAWKVFAGTAEKLVGKIADGVTGAFGAIKSGVKTIWTDVENIFAGAVNFVTQDILNPLIGILNDVLGVFGVHIGKIGKITVGGGGGGSKAQAPGGSFGGSKAFALGGVLPGYSPGHDNLRVPMHWFSGGEGVLVPEATRALGGAPAIQAINAMFSSRVSMPGHYAGGGTVGSGNILGGAVVGSGTGGVVGGVGDVLGAIGGAAGNAVSSVVDLIRRGAADAAIAALKVAELPVRAILGTGATPFANTLAGGIFDKINSDVYQWIRGQAAKSAKAASAGGGAIPTGDHLAMIQQALILAGVQDTPGNEAAVNTIVSHESGWNASAINLTDSNAQAGHPSQGLMQTIPGTFEAYRLGSLPDVITNPLANLVAGIRYAVSRYGSLGNVPGVAAVANGGGYVGYDLGGIVPPGASAIMNRTGKPEALLNPQQWDNVGRLAQAAADPETKRLLASIDAKLDALKVLGTYAAGTQAALDEVAGLGHVLTGVSR